MMDLRESKLGVCSADWARCMRRETLSVKQLAVNIESKQVALLVEAQLAAKSILARPFHVRGGPWLSVRTLPASEMSCVGAVAGMTTLAELAAYIETLSEDNRLWQHVKDVRFTKALFASPTVALPSTTHSQISSEPLRVQSIAKATATRTGSTRVRAKSTAAALDISQGAIIV